MTPEPSVHMHQWLSRAVMHARRSFGDMRPTDEVLDLLGGEAGSASEHIQGLK